MAMEILILIIIQLAVLAFLIWRIMGYIRGKKQERKARRDFEKKVKDACTIPTKSGIKVQSQGEKRIADWLYDHNIEFLYDTPMKVPGRRLPLRPDFYLKKHKSVIEFFGLMEDWDYARNSTKKVSTYWQMNLGVLSIYPDDLDKLDTKLSKFFNKLTL